MNETAADIFRNPSRDGAVNTARLLAVIKREAEPWIVDLRSRGIKAAHPDDGWVNRAENSVQLVYPQFEDDVVEGAVIALGWPDHYRLVRVTKIQARGMIAPAPHYFFEVVK